jgi:hypothetical protein
MQTWSLVLLSTAGLLAACGSDAPPAEPDASTAAQLAATVTPATVTAGESFTITVDIDNFEVVDPTMTSGVEPGQGHFHFQLDTAESYTAAWRTSVTVPTTGETAGVHTIRVWLVDGTHLPITPLTETTVSVTIE